MASTTRDGRVEASITRRILRTSEAAHYMGLSASSLEKMRISGRGPRFTRLGGRAVRDATPPPRRLRIWGSVIVVGVAHRPDITGAVAPRHGCRRRGKG